MSFLLITARPYLFVVFTTYSILVYFMYRGMIIHRSLSGVLLVGLLWPLVQHSSAGCTVDCCGQNTRCCFQIQEGDKLGRLVGNASELPELQSTLTLSLQSVNFGLGMSQYSASLAINDSNGVAIPTSS